MTTSSKKQRSIVDVLEGSAWPALFVLWMGLAVAWLMSVREPESTWLAVLVAVWVGFTGSSALSERAGWWWIGTASIALGALGAAAVGWMAKADYPVSDVPLTPFVAGASPRWHYGGAVVVLGIAASVAVRSRVQGSGLPRAAMVSLVAIFYLAKGPFPFLPDDVPMGLIALTLTLVAVGLGEHAAALAAANRALRRTAAVTVSLAGMLMAAGIVWRFILVPPTISNLTFGMRQVDDVVPLTTPAVAILLGVTIGIWATRRLPAAAPQPRMAETPPVPKN